MKEHWTVDRYKKNYNLLKEALKDFDSRLLEILYFEQKGISEKGIRNILKIVGALKKKIYSSLSANKKLFMKSEDSIENYFKPALEAIKKSKNGNK